jgi:hypothetical protein
MKNSDIIADILSKIDANLLIFTDTLRELYKLDKLCNSPILDPNYRTVIKDFSSSWLKLNTYYRVTILNKVHIIMDHPSDYFLETGQTFNKKSDQTIESVHQLFYKLLMKGYYFKNINSLSFQ